MTKTKYQRTAAHQRYVLSNGLTVPGVTTIIGSNLGWNKGALVGWARKEALAGRDPNKVRDAAADIGTLAHFMIECHLRDNEPDLAEFAPAIVDKAENCFLAYLEWEKAHDVKAVAMEVQCVSEDFEYGGTYDLRAIIDGNMTIVDYKSSASLYAEYVIQGAALCNLEYERIGMHLPYHVLMLGKDDGVFSHHPFTPEQLKPYWDIFIHLLELDKLHKVVK